MPPAPQDGPSSAAAEVSPAGPAAGVIHDFDGRRIAHIAPEFVRSLHATLHEAFGAEAPALLYRTGFEWGLREVTALHHRLRDEFGESSDLWQMDARFVLESWWKPLAALGWGSCTLAGLTPARGLTQIDVRGSLVVAALERATPPVCHLYAGLFAGAFSFFDRAERHGTEIRCCASGEDRCTFVVGPGPEIDAIETWRKQGATADAIVRQLK